jgi:hypothetical protein
MALPQAAAAAEDLRHAHRELLGVVDSLSDEQWGRWAPYGAWTVKDLVAHVIGDMSPSGPGLILAGVLTPSFIASTSKSFDVRARNAAIVEERRRYTREDLRQLLFQAHDAMIDAMLRLDEKHIPILEYEVPIGPGYSLKVEDWLWHGYHDRQHADDIRRALEIDWQPEHLNFAPEIEPRLRTLVRSQEAFLRAVYSIAGRAWEEESGACPGWRYKDILAHVASNETRRRTRLLSALGEAPPAQLRAINDVDAWNAEAVAQRRAWPVRKLVDELQAGWHSTLQVLSRFQGHHLAQPIPLGNGETASAGDFLDRMSAHACRHGGHLVPASRARWGRK